MTVWMMTSAMHHIEQEPDPKAKEVPPIDLTDTATAEKRRLRAEALRRYAGIWATRQDIPADGLDYERALRNEWQ